MGLAAAHYRHNLLACQIAFWCCICIYVVFLLSYVSLGRSMVKDSPKVPLPETMQRRLRT